MDHAVFKFCQLGTVPSVCRAYEVASDALELVYLAASTVRTYGKPLIGVLESAVHAPVPVVVYGTVAYVIFVHKVHDRHNCLRIVSCISVYLHVEDVAASGKRMVWRLDFRLVLRGAFVIYRNMLYGSRLSG